MSELLVTSEKSLSAVRREIDNIDDMLVTLLAKRYEFVTLAAGFKATPDAVRAPDRVNEVIGRVRTRATDLGLSPELVEAVYRVLIEESIRLELRELYEQARNA